MDLLGFCLFAAESAPKNISEIVGIWIAAFLTICLFSFLYEDNPFYKFAEHLYIGVSAGYIFCINFWNTLMPMLWQPLFTGKMKGTEDITTIERLLLFIPLILGILMVCKLVPSISWVSRWPIAFVVGTTLGLSIISKTQANIVAQVRATVKPFQAVPASLFNEFENSIADSEKKIGEKDGLLTKDEFKEFRRRFILVAPPDRDGDDWISFQEVQKFQGFSQDLFDAIDEPRSEASPKKKEGEKEEKDKEKNKDAKDPPAAPTLKQGELTVEELQRFLDYLAHIDANSAKQGRLTNKDLEAYPTTLNAAFIKADQSGDGKLALDEIKGLPEELLKARTPETLLAMWDYNKDSLVSLWEISFAANLAPLADEMQQLSGSAAKGEFVLAELSAKTKALFDLAKLDVNKDNKIQFQEISSYEGMTENLFKAIDSNKDGYIATSWEYKEFKENFPEDIDFYMVRQDRNNDGKIDDRERRTGHLLYWNDFKNRTIIDNLIILVAVISTLIYFFFSKEHTGAFGVASRLGIYSLMVCFGAAFGYTVMARISLLIGRVMFLMRDWLHLIE